MDVWTGLTVAAIIIGSFILFTLFMFRATEALGDEVFDGEGIKLRKVLPFIFWLLCGTYVLIFKIVTIASVVSTVKNSHRNWRN